MLSQPVGHFIVFRQYQNIFYALFGCLQVRCLDICSEKRFWCAITYTKQNALIKQPLEAFKIQHTEPSKSAI